MDCSKFGPPKHSKGSRFVEQSKMAKHSYTSECGQRAQPEEANQDADNERPELLATTRVFTNPLLVLKILKKLQTNDLLRCRLVNKDHSILTTKILQRRNALKVCLKQAAYLGEFAMSSNSRLTLNKLTTLLKTTTGFPASCFSFEGELDSPSAREFFKLNGEMVNEIMMTHQFDTILALSLLANLQSLSKLFLLCGVTPYVVPRASKSKQLASSESNYQLSSLTSIVSTYQCLYGCIEEIIKASPSLVSCIGNLSAGQSMLLIDRIHVLKGLELEMNFTTHLGHVKKLAGTNVHLETLAVDFRDDRSVSNITPECKLLIYKLLELSKSTLKAFEYVMWGKLPFVFKCPKLKELRKLVVKVAVSSGITSDKMIELTEDNFPELQTVSVMSTNDGKFISWYRFPFKGKATSVNTLSINGPFEISLEVLTMFPFLQKLCILELTNFSVTGKIMWQMTGLEFLELKLQWDEEMSILVVDQIFTGFSEETLLHLYQLPEDALREKIESTDEHGHASMLDLKNLRKLRFHVLDCKQYAERFDPNINVLNRNISPVLKTWFLCMFPNLTVELNKNYTFPTQ